MEHVVWTIFLKHLVHSPLSANTGHNNLSFDVGKILRHHQTNVMLWCFRLIYQNHTCWLIDSNLAHHLRANGSCRTCNQHLLSFQQFSNTLHVHLYFFSWQQVFHRHLLQLDIRQIYVCIIFVPFLSTLNHEDFHASANQYVLQLYIVTKLSLTEWRYQNSLNTLTLNNAFQVITKVIHLLAHQGGMLQFRIMRDKSFKDKALRTYRVDILGQPYSTRHSTINEYSQRTLVRCRYIVNGLCHHTCNPH